MDIGESNKMNTIAKALAAVNSNDPDKDTILLVQLAVCSVCGKKKSRRVKL